MAEVDEIIRDLLVGESGRLIAGHRYVMVTAIQRSYKRSGYATAILDALFEHLRESGVDSVEWLVHPAPGSLWSG